MNAVDLKNAFDPIGRGADNFTVLLLRLIAKADGNNKEKLRQGFPVEVKATEIYRGACPYKDGNKTEVDWDQIVNKATSPLTDGQLLMRAGFSVDCQSPFEIGHVDGSSATGLAAKLVVRQLRDEYEQDSKGLNND